VSKQNHSIEQNKIFGNVYLKKLSDSSIRIVCESLNNIFEIYGDDKYQQVFIDLNIYEKLSIFVTVLENKIKQSMNDNDDEELIEFAKEQYSNLLIFLKEKK
jgi:hypothetical protein